MPYGGDRYRERGKVQVYKISETALVKLESGSELLEAWKSALARMGEQHLRPGRVMRGDLIVPIQYHHGVRGINIQVFHNAHDWFTKYEE